MRFSHSDIELAELRPLFSHTCLSVCLALFSSAFPHISTCQCHCPSILLLTFTKTVRLQELWKTSVFVPALLSKRACCPMCQKPILWHWVFQKTQWRESPSCERYSQMRIKPLGSWVFSQKFEYFLKNPVRGIGFLVIASRLTRRQVQLKSVCLCWLQGSTFIRKALGSGFWE